MKPTFSKRKKSLKRSRKLLLDDNELKIVSKYCGGQAKRSRMGPPPLPTKPEPKPTKKLSLLQKRKEKEKPHLSHVSLHEDFCNHTRYQPGKQANTPDPVLSTLPPSEVNIPTAAELPAPETKQMKKKKAQNKHYGRTIFWKSTNIKDYSGSKRERERVVQWLRARLSNNTPGGNRGLVVQSQSGVGCTDFILQALHQAGAKPLRITPYDHPQFSYAEAEATRTSTTQPHPSSRHGIPVVPVLDSADAWFSNRDISESMDHELSYTSSSSDPSGKTSFGYLTLKEWASTHRFKSRWSPIIICVHTRNSRSIRNLMDKGGWMHSRFFEPSIKETTYALINTWKKNLLKAENMFPLRECWFDCAQAIAMRSPGNPKKALMYASVPAKLRSQSQVKAIVSNNPFVGALFCFSGGRGERFYGKDHTPSVEELKDAVNITPRVSELLWEFSTEGWTTGNDTIEDFLENRESFSKMDSSFPYTPQQSTSFLSDLKTWGTKQSSTGHIPSFKNSQFRIQLEQKRDLKEKRSGLKAYWSRLGVNVGENQQEVCSITNHPTDLFTSLLDQFGFNIQSKIDRVYELKRQRSRKILDQFIFISDEDIEQVQHLQSLSAQTKRSIEQ